MNIEFQNNDNRYLIIGDNISVCHIYKWSNDYETRYANGLCQTYYTPTQYPYRVLIYFKQGRYDRIELEATKQIATTLYETIKKHIKDDEMLVEVSSDFSWKSICLVER